MSREWYFRQKKDKTRMDMEKQNEMIMIIVIYYAEPIMLCVRIIAFNFHKLKISNQIKKRLFEQYILFWWDIKRTDDRRSGIYKWCLIICCFTLVSYSESPVLIKYHFIFCLVTPSFLFIYCFWCSLKGNFDQPIKDVQKVNMWKARAK